MKTCYLLISLLLSSSLHGQVITTIAGNGTPGFSGEGGPAINAEFEALCGVAADKWGNIYLADWVNDVIQKIDTNGIINRFAGNGISGYSGDGGQATTAQLELFLSVGIAIDTVGNIYFADGGRIRMINTSGIITTIAGNGGYGFSGDGGAAIAAEFKAPTGICFDKTGNLYIADEQNENIRKINSMGIISTIAGHIAGIAGYSGDGGPATDAQLTSPSGIGLDDSGNIYFADYLRIRRINSSGIISTIAGDPFSMGPIICEGCHATDLKLEGPLGIAIDHFGNMYFSDIVNSLIQKITRDGLAYTIAGNGTRGYGGDGGPPTMAELYAPMMICFDNGGDLLICDKDNNRLRKVSFGTTSVPPLPHLVAFPQLSIFPNPVTNNEFACNLTTNTNEAAKMVITNILGQIVFTTSFITNRAINIYLNVPPGFYFVTAYTAAYKMQAKLVVE